VLSAGCLQSSNVLTRLSHRSNPSTLEAHALLHHNEGQLALPPLYSNVYHELDLIRGHERLRRGVGPGRT
jgi:hypothetical protein